MQETKRAVLLYAGVDLSSPNGLKLREEMTQQQLIITKLLLLEESISL